MSVAEQSKLVRVGKAAIAARMTDYAVEQDPARAFHIAMDAMRATLGLEREAKPDGRS